MPRCGGAAVTDFELPRMRDEWNERAREDAHYYVAFGQRNQDDDAFFATAAEVLATLEAEMARGLPCAPGEARILEIGCGPGRLMRPMSRHAREIHGVDVSDEMIGRARRNLAAIPHAFPRVGTGATLDGYADASFDYGYSYAVFQHIPSRGVVLSYLREMVRVLKPGGLARLQLNGLPIDAREYTTWAGVRFAPHEIRDFARLHGLQLLALEGLGTQYMWTTWRKAPAHAPEPGSIRIRRVTNAFNTEPVAPVTGRFAALSLWVEGVDERADLNTIEVSIDGRPATLTYLGRAAADGLRQLNALLPAGLAPGLATLELAGATRPIRLLPPPPVVPRVVSVSDGVDLLSGPRISSGIVKLTVEEFDVSRFEAVVAGQPAPDWESFEIDPIPPRHEINLRLPPGLAGPVAIELRVSGRTVYRTEVELVAGGTSGEILLP